MIEIRWILCLCIGLMLIVAGISILMFTPPHTNIVPVGIDINQGISLHIGISSSVSITIERANSTVPSNSNVTNSTQP